MILWVTFLLLAVTSARARMNVLFLVSDDMRPELSIFEGPDFPSPVHPPMHSPNLDALARRSLLLKRAHVQQAVCSPSRSSLLTGRRPDTTHVYNLQDYWRVVGGNFTTIPQYFKENGYRTIGSGKIFHPGHASDNNDPISWTDPYFEAGTEANAFVYKDKVSWMNVPMDLLKNNSLQDTQNADFAIKMIREAAPQARSGERPFFIAQGFHKPHLPFVAPQMFFDMYPESSISLPANPYAPDKMPDIAWSSYGELRNYVDIAKLNASGDINSTLPNDVILGLRRAYYSALSYTDYELGRVVKELENQGLANNTIISFWGDHGWQLGEHGEWCKHTDFEIATHAPMMVHVPGLTDNGIMTEELTEFVDLFPTLVEAAGLTALDLCPENSTNVLVCSEGNSLVPLMKDPASPNWKKTVFSQYPRSADNGHQMGYSMTTAKYRYTEWVKFDMKPLYKPDWNKVYGVELYDHIKDPEENYNLAYNSAEKKLVSELRKELHAGWRAARPRT
ncbi:iduronate 2-sulfatase-like [Haliotis rufescens]|uniref:iduronate 2-sulfatase-like n=1 Tax=Haliotis rufescens TaxID=6454 RepID=UPI00201F1C78|nr:iduronate 2-sulfatase-like [Haliotis rufescens]